MKSRLTHYKQKDVIAKEKKLSKLEIILIGIILLLIIGMIGAIALRLFGNNKYFLELRFNKFESLAKEKNASEAYDDFLSQETKNKITKKDAIDGVAKTNGVTFDTQINKIIIEGNIGYVDRTTVNCYNNDCSEKEVLRGYKKWVYENGNWYATIEYPRCIRTEMYDMQPEFSRALSLIKQRVTDYYNNSVDLSFFNCLNVEYGDVGDAEGLFTFDENDSDIDRLKIKVDKSYVNNDDLLTAFLLTHETTHAGNYLDKVMKGKKIPCVDDEVVAFSNQLRLSGLLNQEERESLNARLQKGYQNLNNQLKTEWDLLILRDQAERICGTNQFDACTQKEVIPLIEDMVRNNSYYQKQCNL